MKQANTLKCSLCFHTAARQAWHDVSLDPPRAWHLDSHFQAKFNGTARLPVLAVNALLMCICREFPRYSDKQLLPLSSHTSADSRSGSVGDIEIFDQNGTVFEAYEVKHNIEINRAIIDTAKEKILSTTIKNIIDQNL